MTTKCEYAKNVRNGMEKYLLCEITKNPCAFQRYCVVEEDVINTEGVNNCGVREEENKNKPTRKKSSNKSKKGIVTLVAKNYVIYTCNGESCFKDGSFDVSIGDEIDV